MIGFAVGCLATLAIGTIVRGTRPVSPPVVGFDGTCEVAILLYRAPPQSLVDAHTGGLGYSHVALEACERGPHGPMVLDCRPGLGVARIPRARALAHRRVDRVPLPATWAAETYGAARAQVGQPFTPGHDGVVCSTWLYGALPLEARHHVDRFRRYSCAGLVSPNQLAAAFWALREPVT